MHFDAPKNSNYCACVVKLEAFVQLANCDNVKAALVFGNSVIVAKSVEPGAIGLYFPVETQLTRDFLANNSLFRKPEWGNMDPEKKGFFEEHGRVKAVKFRGHKSEGFWIPLDSLAYLGIPLDEFPVGAEFDSIADRVICRKYVPRHQGRVGSGPRTLGDSLKIRAEMIAPGQFRFHPDTDNLRRNVYRILPDEYISISTKFHGTSAVFAHVLVNRKLNWLHRLLLKLGVPVQQQEYGFAYSSRKVIKAVFDSNCAPLIGTHSIHNGELHKRHFYSEDIWGVVAQEIKDRIPKGFTVYGEIVGWTTDGGAIQKGYHYGCQPGTHRFLVYRATQTNADGFVVELSWDQLKEFCELRGFEMVKELWYGKAERFACQSSDMADWHQAFLAKLESEYVNDGLCPYNNLEVPAEGIVVRVDQLHEARALKLKNWNFLERESKGLDAGTVDMETQEAETSEEISL